MLRVLISFLMPTDKLQHRAIEPLALVVGRGMARVAGDEQARIGNGMMQKLLGRVGHGRVMLTRDNERWRPHPRQLPAHVKYA